MRASNEELRSALEELASSREELQLANEELQTLNEENRGQVEEMRKLSSDLQNLLRSTKIATLFLDRSLRIQRFTPRVGELFNVRHIDRGRPLSDFTHRLGYDGLLDDAERVLRTLEPVEHEVESGDGERRWYLVRVMPYRTMDDRVEGVVVTLVDITAPKRSEAQLRELSRSLEARVARRTAELARANETLAREVAERRRAEAARTRLLRQLASTEEEERRRLSRELHDEMGQLLTGLLLGLRALERGTGSGTPAAKIQDLVTLVDHIAREMQNLAVQLRPPALENLGLELALRSHLEEWSERHGIATDFHSVGLNEERFPPEVESTLYRVAQEGLTNVLKHAGATRVSLLLERRGGSLSVIIEDDGAGFDVEEALTARARAKRLGLRGMRERVALLGGTLEIESSHESGTTVFARVPAQPPSEPAAAEAAQP